jgi:hypothetical protein
MCSAASDNADAVRAAFRAPLHMGTQRWGCLRGSRRASAGRPPIHLHGAAPRACLTCPHSPKLPRAPTPKVAGHYGNGCAGDGRLRFEPGKCQIAFGTLWTTDIRSHRPFRWCYAFRRPGHGEREGPRQLRAPLTGQCHVAGGS